MLVDKNRVVLLLSFEQSDGVCDHVLSTVELNETSQEEATRKVAASLADRGNLVRVLAMPVPEAGQAASLAEYTWSLLHKEEKAAGQGGAMERWLRARIATVVREFLSGLPDEQVAPAFGAVLGLLANSALKMAVGVNPPLAQGN